MADYHLMNDGMFSVGGSDIMDEAANMVNAGGYGHASAVNSAGQSMMPQNMQNTSGPNPNMMMSGMVPMQQAQGGAQMPAGGLSSYHQGAVHSYQQNEVPQKLHQYSVYGSQLQASNMAGQYVSGGPRLHHLSDPLSSIPDQPQQSSPRTVVPNQMYQNRNMSAGHYGQQMPHNAASAPMNQSSAQYPGHYGSMQHHSMQQHAVQQVNQTPDMWQSSMAHSQMTRPCMPASQNYPQQHQMVPNQHASASMNHSPMAMQSQRASTSNQSQYLSNQEYPTQHATNQQSPMQRPPVYNMNSSTVSQNGSMVGQLNAAPQTGMPQTLNSLSQADQSMTFSQGHYGASQTSNRPHYNAVGHPPQQQVMGQQMMNARSSAHQMGYSPVTPRVNSVQPHASSVPPGSPARLQQYHPPFSPNQAYSTAQPSPRPTNPESATPPHLHYSNSQHVQAPMSPQYRTPFSSQVTHSPQHLTPTPPSDMSVPPALTPERVLQSSTPQSQGSYHSPSTTHLTSPGQGHSPGNSNAPSSLQHLEQMVLPRVSTGPSTTPTPSSLSPSGSNSSMGHSSGGNYYSHLSNTHSSQQQTPPQQQAPPPPQHHMLMSSVGETRPQPPSPAFTHVSQAHPHHTYLNQPHSVAPLPSPTVSSVPNSSQPLPPSTPTMPNLTSNASLLPDENIAVESSQPSAAVSFGSDSSSSMPSVSVGDSSSGASRNMAAVPPMSTSEQIMPLSSSANSANETLLPPSHQYNMLSKAPYPGSSPPVAFEVQQINQELQSLYGIPQNPEVIEKIKGLQERLRYLQTPQNSSTPNTLSSNVAPMSPHYPKSMMYGSGNSTPYMHQPMIQPHPVHYNPQAPQPAGTTPQEVPPAPMQQSLPPTLTDSMPSLSDQGVCDPESMGPNYPPTSFDGMPPMSLQDKSDMPPDPYEMTFNDEPPPKMKRRQPKEPKAKKPPKSPKQPKSPKVKKPKKGKKSDQMPVLDPLQGPSENLVPTQELAEGLLPSVPLQEGAPLPLPDAENSGTVVVAEASETKPKKPRKRKTKESDGEPKEPKPKKPRKKPEKKPKQPKNVEGAEEGVPNDGNNNSLENAEGDKPPDAAADAQGSDNAPADEEAKENQEVTEKDVKEKKPKSKSPKASKDGTPKEPKKSTPKKKLPKIALKFTSKKKKKKPLAVSDHSDIEKTPPPSPVDDNGVTKRRSARNTERKKYTDDIELHLSDDETIEMDFGQRQDGKLVQVVVDNHNEDYMVVEKILAIRTVKKPVEKDGSDAENAGEEETVDVEEYYVKYKNLSYIHCDWKTLEELEKGDRRFIQKVKRFKQKKETFNFFDFLEEDPFNPDYIEVDRVLAVNIIKEVISPTGEVTLAPPSPKPSKSADEEPPEKDAEGKTPSEPPAEGETKSEEAQNEGEEKTEEKTEEAPLPVEEGDATTVKPDTEPLPPTVMKPESSETDDNIVNEMDEEKNPEPEVPKEAEVKEEEAAVKVDDDDAQPQAAAEDQTAEEAKPPGEEGDNKEGEEKKNEPEEEEKKEEESMIRITRHYLVKWRALTYEESTWELEDDVDQDKIELFLRFKDPPPKEKWKTKKRPRPAEWNQLDESPVYKGGNTLREYQLEGVNWLTFCWYNSQNCILADEMGLGKTIQSITFLNEIDKYGIPGPFLVIAPLSTIGNWQREFETWTDLNAITYHGSSPSRNMILEYEMYWRNEEGERIQDVYKFQVMITTFEIILTDCMELKAIPWRCVIIDEAHRLKNRNCKLLEGLRMLNTEHRVLLTGTPLQNNVEELFSLLNFLEPNRFASTEAFLEEFGNLKTESQVDKLKALLKPMMLRRLKEDVEKSLAPKEETVVEVELTNIQKKYYRAILERNFTFLTKGNCYSNIPNLMNTMMELRKCCIHPFLINGAEEQIINDYKTQHEESPEGHLNAMIQSSGKLVLMDKLLPRLRTDGHRVLVFSQMVRCLDILEDYLVQKRYPYERLDGRVRGNLRQEAIDRFCKPDSDRFVFLLCTRAGGLGINLTAADTVIIFDSDWNPQNDLQAQARCHRIGQSKAVKVYRLICRNTYEREMFDKASLKLGLDKAVLQSMSVSKENVGMNQQMSKKEIEDLLRKGAYGALMEDDNAGDKFCEEDIDQILQRRTQVITLESGTKGSTFSKATFASASTRSDIEIDDPNFWEKWAKKANLDVDELKTRNELIIQEPRRRTQTRRFGTDDIIDLSELESSDEDDENISSRTRASRGKGSKIRGKGRGRDRDDDFMDDIPPGNWTRAECYKMEKGLLTFGWGRWDECMAIGQFRRRMSHKDCEEISRTILLYCLLHYKGDEKIKSFIWDLIAPNYDGEERIHKNHSGLSAPVPRGRKGKKIKKETKTVDQIIEECEWTKEEVNNPDSLLNDEIYKRHLNRHSNKVLLRVRLLYYLKHEIIGDLHDQILSGRNANDIPLYVPPADGEPPTPWWNVELDKSLLIGIYKHGFERYNIMRQDPMLCFLSRCGPPDGAALLAELNPVTNEDDIEDSSIHKDNNEDMDPLSPSNEHDAAPRHIPNHYHLPHGFEMGIIHFPSVTDVNTRVRRLVTAFQRNNKKLEIRNAQKAKKIERREKFEAAIREREMKKRELQQRKWSRREEADFYRTISSFGVEYNEETKEYNWSRFRGIARLERKYDETLAEYYKCFYAMCKRVCGRELTEEEEQLSMNVEPISEERASRCLQRVELLNKIREEILCHPDLDERLKLCQPSMDLPDWWVCGKHDKDLLIGAAKHGLSRMDYHLLHDPNLSFKDVLKNIPNAKALQIGNMLSTPLGCPSPLNIYHTEDSILLKDEGSKVKEEPPASADEVKIDISAAKQEVSDNPTEPVASNEKDQKDAPIDESSEVKSEVLDKEIKQEKDDAEVQVEEPAKDKDPEMKVEEVKENENPETEVKTEEPTADVSPKVETEPVLESKDETDTSKMEDDDPLDRSNELKIDEDVKMEDEETDIETDARKDEDDADEKSKEEGAPEEKKSEGAVGGETPMEQGNEKDDHKYDCDTDTETKSNSESAVQSMEVEESPLVKMEKAMNSEKCLGTLSEKFMKVKQEEMMYEEGMRDRFNIQKMLPKDDLHSHVDDSQMIAILQGCMSQNDDVMSQASFNLETEMGEPTVAQLLAFTNGNAVRWPKDKVLQIRLEHIVHAVEKNEWPIIRHTFLPTFPPTVPQSSTPVPPISASPVSHRTSPVPSISSQGHSGEVTPQATPEHTPQRDVMLPDIPTPTPPDFSVLRKSPLHIPPPPVTETSRHSRRRRRRRRFEIEAERAKLRQLLSHNMQQQQQHHQQQLQHVQQFLASSPLRGKIWDDHVESKVPNVPSPSSAVPTVSPTIPPPAHQNSAPRLSTTLGTLDLSVKPNITPPTPFTPLPAPQKAKVTPPVEAASSAGGSPTSPIDLSASSSGTATSQGNPSAHQQNPSKGHSRPREKRGAKGGSRIDALALNLQARKQQQLMQEQHHPLADIGSMVERTVEKGKEHGEMEESRSSRHSSHHHSERRTVEEEEIKLRKKRLQYSEESVRKAMNRGFDMQPVPAHSSFMNPSMSGSSGRMNLGSGKSEEHSGGSNNPLLDPSSLMHHDFKKWIDEHPELVTANPNLVAAAAAAMASFSPVSSFPSHTELLELPEGRRRGRRPRLDPTKLDYDKVTGEENVSVINRLTGKKGNLPNNMSKRIVTPSEKRGRRTAASLLASAHQSVVPPVTTMSFPSTGLNPLNFANTGMLSGFPNMKFFMDPPKSNVSSTSTTPTTSSTTTNPIFLPFGGLAGMGLTNPLFGFPGFNFPGLQGSSGLTGANLPSSKEHGKDGDKNRSEKDTSRKNSSASSSATSVNMSANANLPQSSLPFLYPPGLLYNPLGLGGFTLPPNLPASFGSFSQSGLVNGLGLSNPLFTTSSLGTSLSSSTTTATATTPATHSILSATPSLAKTVPHTTSPSKLPSNHFADGQETDDESLKSLMGNHEDDDDEMDDGKMESFDNPDSDKEGFRDRQQSPAMPPKTPQNDPETVNLAKTHCENSSLELSSKSRGTHDDPTSDSTDTESKHS